MGWRLQHCLSKICDGLCGAHTCAQPQHCHKGATHHCYCGINSTNISINTSQCFSTVIGVHCCPLCKKFTRITSFSSQKALTMILAAHRTILNLFFLGDVIWQNSTNCCLDSGSKQWTQVSFYITICDKKTSPVWLYWCKRENCDCFPCFSVCICQHLWQLKSMTWNNPCYHLPLHCLYRCIGWSITLLLSSDSCHTPLHKPSGHRETSNLATAQLVIKFGSSCFSSFNLFHPKYLHYKL